MLTYCTNIHPGESWDEVRDVIWPEVMEVKRGVSPLEAFPVGLRLSALAARCTESEAQRFQETCLRQGCFIPTLNGFPYGSFHGASVKEQVYRPDWRDSSRVAYTLDLARLLRLWLPAGVTGSISTVPIGYAPDLRPSDLPLIKKNLITVLRELLKAAESGKKMVLALEPEPGCLLETARDVVRFHQMLDLPDELRPFLGVCYDCCHSAVVFEEPAEAFALLEEAGIPVVKIHVSSAALIRTDHLAGARMFHEPRYLHQTVIRDTAGVSRYRDLTDALSAPAPDPAGEWRIHFHLPLFDDGNERYGTSNWFTRKALACRPPEALLEIETYTYHVLPGASQPDSISGFICREFSWVRGCL